jgi:hypothetical protein
MFSTLGVRVQTGRRDKNQIGPAPCGELAGD